jgi:hypothetical protein
LLAKSPGFSALAIDRADGCRLKTPDSEEQISIVLVPADFFPAASARCAPTELRTLEWPMTTRQ